MLDLNHLTRGERIMLSKYALDRAEMFAHAKADRTQKLSARAMSGVAADRWGAISRALDPALDHMDHAIDRRPS